MPLMRSARRRATKGRRIEMHREASMFDKVFAKLPVEPPRRVESLPGLKLRGVIAKWAIVLPLFFVVFFLFIPLSLLNSDPAMRMATGATDTVQGPFVSVSSASACRGAASHRVVYTFSSPAGRAYRGAAILCEESPSVFGWLCVRPVETSNLWT
jgi:hypothetical protein